MKQFLKTSICEVMLELPHSLQKIFEKKKKKQSLFTSYSQLVVTESDFAVACDCGTRVIHHLLLDIFLFIQKQCISTSDYCFH